MNSGILVHRWAHEHVLVAHVYGFRHVVCFHDIHFVFEYRHGLPPQVYCNAHDMQKLFADIDPTVRLLFQTKHYSDW